MNKLDLQKHLPTHLRLKIQDKVKNFPQCKLFVNGNLKRHILQEHLKEKRFFVTSVGMLFNF